MGKEQTRFNMTKYDELKVNGEVVNFEQTSSPVEQLANKNDT